MNLHRIFTSRGSASTAVGVVCAVAVAACGGGGSGSSSSLSPAPQPTTMGFTDKPLVSNNVGVVATSTIVDANLQNPWGIAVAPGLPFWIADNNSNRLPFTLARAKLRRTK
jgi:hypothetical protein